MWTSFDLVVHWLLWRQATGNIQLLHTVYVQLYVQYSRYERIAMYDILPNHHKSSERDRVGKAWTRDQYTK